MSENQTCLNFSKCAVENYAYFYSFALYWRENDGLISIQKHSHREPHPGASAVYIDNVYYSAIAKARMLTRTEERMLSPSSV